MRETTQKVSINSDNKVVFECPECKTSKTVDVSRYEDIEKAVMVKAKCQCGHTYTVVMEKRGRFRKETELYGVYSKLGSKTHGQKGLLTIKDVSPSGLKSKLSLLRLKIKQHDLSGIKDKGDILGFELQNPEVDLDVGDKLLVEFHLDDGQRSLIKKEAVIKWIKLPYIGVEFSSTELYEKALGFFMWD